MPNQEEEKVEKLEALLRHFLLYDREAEKFGLDPILVHDAVWRGELDAIIKLSVGLLLPAREIMNRRAQKDLFDPNLGPRDRLSFIKYLAALMVEQCHAEDMPSPAELVELLGVILGAERWGKNKFPNPIAWSAAARLLAEKPDISNRALANQIEVDPKSIINWKADAQFMEQVAYHKVKIDGDGR